jgi:hypothetical protein
VVVVAAAAAAVALAQEAAAGTKVYFIFINNLCEVMFLYTLYVRVCNLNVWLHQHICKH